ncbi:hypothetical protein [Amycolatopsis sp. lyj-112]|uniref:hypothetical protein n=1 Tax=Amycolatopsis sp. lyj-112 TaxID=2789288 RepID=UPI00397B86C1
MTNTQDGGELHRRCEEIIRSLPVRYPFELNAFLCAVGMQQGIPIELWRMNHVRSTRTGQLLRTYLRNYVFVVRRTTAWHARHIAFHEVAHLLLGHPSERICVTSPRSSVRGTEEEHAEYFAYLLSDYVRAGERAHRRRVTGARRQLLSAFGSRRHLSFGCCA